MSDTKAMVERLRYDARHCIDQIDSNTLHDAAYLIERLQAELQHKEDRGVYLGCVAEVKKLRSERDQARYGEQDMEKQRDDAVAERDRYAALLDELIFVADCAPPLEVFSRISDVAAKAKELRKP